MIVFVKVATQKSSFYSASSSKSKTFIDITPQAPKKANNVQKGKQVVTQKPIYPKVSYLEVLENQVIPFDVYKHTLPQPFWCEYS